jgi:hypothetical protein
MHRTMPSEYNKVHRNALLLVFSDIYSTVANIPLFAFLANMVFDPTCGAIHTFMVLSGLLAMI